jgi:hypothetical protein
MRYAPARTGTAVFALLFAALALYSQETKDTRKRPTKSEAGRSEQKQEQHHPPQGQQSQSQPQQQQPQQSQPPQHFGRPPQQQPASTTPPQPQQQQQQPQSQEPQHFGRPPQQPPGSTPAQQQPQQPVRPTPAYRPPLNQGNPNPPIQRGGFGAGNDRPGPRPLTNAAPPPRVIRTPNGGMVQHNDAGRLTVVHTPSGAVIHHDVYGARRVEVVRPGGTVVVARAPGFGYVQRPIVVNNVTVVKRTYVVNNVAFVNVYRPVTFGGVVVNVYTPVRYYRPVFYTYAYTPWVRPVPYTWVWVGSPWYGFYGGYFAPYPVYAAPNLWLTDYLLAATLEQAYQQRMAAQAAQQQAAYAAAQGQAPLSPEVKQAIADEVRRELDQERAEQAANGAYNNNGGLPMFADGAPHVFVAYTPLEVNSNQGACVLSEGDVVQLNGAPPPSAAAASVYVMASRGGQDCRKGAVASVQIADLQDMQNQMRATIDRGLGDLQSRQGQGGLPQLPAGAAGTTDTPLTAQAQPDPGVSGQLTQVSRDAEKAEQDVLNQSQNAGTSGPVTISLGQSFDDVKAIQGEPDKIVDLGEKKIYVYKDLKITFTDGKVSDVQ